MINVGLIGYGNWGKIIYKKLEMLCNVKFICRSKDDYISRLDEVDWVFIATPNHTHYKIVKECLKRKKNVFCEKPLTPTFMQSEKIFKLADAYGVKLYVDDIMNWGMKINDFKKYNTVIRTKKSKGYSRELLYRLAYHDIYYLYEYINGNKIKSIDKINSNYDLHFNIVFDNSQLEFIYDINSDNKQHRINDIDMINDEDILYKMIKKNFSKILYLYDILN